MVTSNPLDEGNAHHVGIYLRHRTATAFKILYSILAAFVDIKNFKGNIVLLLIV